MAEALKRDRGTGAPGDRLRAVVEGVEAATGEEFYRTLVRHLAEALAVDYAFLSEFAEDRSRFRTVAVWGRGALLPNLESPLAGTPCASVLNGCISHHPEDLQRLFPEDVGLVDWGVVSYAGVPVFDLSGGVTGHLAVLDGAPMPDAEEALSIMRIFAARVAAERERLQAEAMLRAREAAYRASEALYRDLYENAPLSYMTFGVDGSMWQWNENARRLTRLTDAQIRGMHVLDFLTESPANLAAFERLGREVYGDGKTMSAELEGKRPDGTLYWARVSIAPVLDAGGTIVGGRSIAQDITELKLAEGALRDSEARLSALIDSALDAIVVFDERGRIEVFNPAAEKVFRVRAAEAIGTSVRRFASPKAGGGPEALEALNSGRQRQVFTKPGTMSRRADGEEFESEATISRVDVSGRTLYMVILRDVEERRRAEEESRRLQRQSDYLEEEIKAAHNFEEIVGQSAALRDVLSQVELVAATDSTVLILGETGTGKELIARALHARSSRRDRPLVKVNCAALPSGLIESEIFGHEKGAFTGALARRVGRFELAHRGTIFLDEIGEMPLDVQAKLLRVLQEREFERVGGSQTIAADVRVIAATNRDLAQLAAHGAFRQDLFYRLNVFPVSLPPLRQRREDIAPLVHYFLGRYAVKVGRAVTRVPPETMARLCAYSWPGNVRELENVIERAVILSRGGDLEVAAELLPQTQAVAGPRPPARDAALGAASQAAAPPPVSRPHRGLDVPEDERRHILAALERSSWRIEGDRGAARALGLSPSTLRSRMQRLGIRRSGGAGEVTREKS